MTYIVNAFAILGYDVLALLSLLSITAALTALGHVLCYTIHAATNLGSEYLCTGVGRMSGFCLGLVWSIGGFYTCGVVLTLVSVVGLGAVIATVMLFFWLFGE